MYSLFRVIYYILHSGVVAGMTGDNNCFLAPFNLVCRNIFLCKK